MLDWDQQDARQVDAATGACLFIRRTALADVGLFDERFFVYYEETDWLIRAKRRGWSTVYLPTVEAVHASAGSSPGVPSRNSLLLLESQHRYARKHYGPARAGLLRATLLGIDGARFVRHGLAGNDERRAVASDRIRVHLTMRAPRPS
jgi:GT2 family glycosyltransferase